MCRTGDKYTCWPGADIAGERLLAVPGVASSQQCAALCEVMGSSPSNTAGGDCSLFVLTKAGACVLRRSAFMLAGGEGSSGPSDANAVACLRMPSGGGCWVEARGETQRSGTHVPAVAGHCCVCPRGRLMRQYPTVLSCSHPNRAIHGLRCTCVYHVAVDVHVDMNYPGAILCPCLIIRC